MTREQFIKEVELTDEDWFDINKKCGTSFVGIIANDDGLSSFGQMDKILELCTESAKAQLDKILKHPDVLNCPPMECPYCGKMILKESVLCQQKTKLQEDGK